MHCVVLASSTSNSTVNDAKGTFGATVFIIVIVTVVNDGVLIVLAAQRIAHRVIR